MSRFVDATMVRFGEDAFVVDMLANGLGLPTIFAAAFTAVDVELQSIAVGRIFDRAYKVPVFETLRTDGTEEQILPAQQRVRVQRRAPRAGRLDWVDVAFKATMATRMKALAAPLAGVTVKGLEDRLGGVATLAELRAKLAALYAPSVVDDLFARLRITSIEDFARRSHLFVELTGAEPPAFDPADPASAREYDVSVCIKISDGFDVGAALQSAKLCRDVLEHEAVADTLDGVERERPYTFVTVFPEGAVTDEALPGHTAAQAKDAVGRLFATERMFVHFVE